MSEGGGQLRRRAVLAAGAVGGVVGLTSAYGLGVEGKTGYGGIMALNEPYNVCDNFWIGPDSEKINVDADSGHVYMASDTHLQYYGDSGSWVKMGLGSQSVPAPSVNAEQAIVNPREPNQWSQGRRPIESTEDITLFVDPNNGADSNDGSSSAPLNTLQEAAYRTPYIQNHDVVIVLRSGTFGGAKFPPIISTAKPNGNRTFEIYPDDGLGSSDITISDTFQLSIIDGEADSAAVRDVTFGGTILQKTGNVTYKDCVFDASGSPLSLPKVTGPIAYNAHASCRGELNNCDFGNKNYGTVAYIAKGCELELNGCTGVVSKFVADVNRGATVIDNGNGVWGKSGFFSGGSGGSLRHRDGSDAHNKTAVADDFGDGQLQDRALHETRPGFYPEYNIAAGSPSASPGKLEFPSGSKHIVQPGVRKDDGNIKTYRFSPMTTGTWRWDFQFQTTPSTGDFELRAIVDDNSHLWRVKVYAGGSIRLQKANDKGVTNVVTGSWTIDTAEHTIEFVRSADIDGNGNTGVELIADDTSHGIATDSYVPQPDTRRLQANSLDADLHIKQIRETREAGTYR